MRAFHALHAAGLIAFAGLSQAPGQAQMIFASEVSAENLVSVNGATLGGVVIGASITDVTGLAYDSVNGVLYGMAASTLYVINQSTGQGTLVTALSTGGNPNGLAFDPELGRLFISDNNSNQLYSYDIGLAQLTLIGAITGGFTSVEGLGYDAATDTLFGLADDQDRIITINTATAAATGLPNVLPGGTWRGLDFDPGSGVLFATRVGAGGILTSVNPLTGLGTDLGPIAGSGTFTFIQGLAVQSVAIPEPSTLILAAIGVALLVVAHRQGRRG